MTREGEPVLGVSQPIRGKVASRALDPFARRSASRFEAALVGENIAAKNIAALGMASSTIEAMGRASVLPSPAVLQIADLTKGLFNPLQQISARPGAWSCPSPTPAASG